MCKKFRWSSGLIGEFEAKFKDKQLFRRQYWNSKLNQFQFGLQRYYSIKSLVVKIKSEIRKKTPWSWKKCKGRNKCIKRDPKHWLSFSKQRRRKWWRKRFLCWGLTKGILDGIGNRRIFKNQN